MPEKRLSNQKTFRHSGRSKWGLSSGGLRPLPAIYAQSSAIVHICGVLSREFSSQNDDNYGQLQTFLDKHLKPPFVRPSFRLSRITCDVFFSLLFRGFFVASSAWSYCVWAFSWGTLRVLTLEKSSERRSGRWTPVLQARRTFVKLPLNWTRSIQTLLKLQGLDDNLESNKSQLQVLVLVEQGMHIHPGKLMQRNKHLLESIMCPWLISKDPISTLVLLFPPLNQTKTAMMAFQNLDLSLSLSLGLQPNQNSHDGPPKLRSLSLSMVTRTSLGITASSPWNLYGTP